MMSLDNYYMHATGGYQGKHNQESRIIDILKDGKIKHTQEQDYICLCDPSKKEVLYDKDGFPLLSSFFDFVLCSPSLVFNRNIKVIEPKYHLDKDKTEEYFADMYDEVRMYEDLPLTNLEFITFPLFEIVGGNNLVMDEIIINQLEVFKDNIQVISKDFTTVPIKNIMTGSNINNEVIQEHIIKVKKQYKSIYY